MMQKSKKKIKFTLNKSLSMNEQLTAFNKMSSIQPINEQEEYDRDGGQKKEVKRQIGIFEQFKIKYDELRKENIQKRNQLDQMNRMNKRLEIQLLNVNTEFYDREIKRLRTQVQKFQEEAEDFKFKYFQTENKRKQFQSSLNVKEKEISKTIKQLQVQKVQNAELKLQLKENQRQYLKIISTVEQSSNKSAERYAECQRKLNVSQSELKKIKRELQNEKKNVEKFQKSKRQLQEENKKTSEKQKIQINSINKLLEDSETRCIEYRKEISSLKEQLSTLTLDLSKNKSLLDFEANKTFEKITQFRSSKVLEIENKQFKQEISTLKKQIQNKLISLNTLQSRLTEAKGQVELQRKQYEQKLHDLLNKKLAIEKHYESKNISLNKQIQMLKVKCIKWESMESNTQNHPKMLTSSLSQGKLSKSFETNPLLVFQNQFQTILNTKDQQIKLLKSNLNKKIDEIFKLKQSLQDLQVSSESMRNQINILEKKLLVQQKNITSRNEIQLIEIQNEIQIFKRKLSQAQIKIGIKSREIKEKDNFITSFIISRVQRQQDVGLVLAEMQRVLQSDYIQKLVNAQGRIKALEGKMLSN